MINVSSLLATNNVVDFHSEGKKKTYIIIPTGIIITWQKSAGIFPINTVTGSTISTMDSSRIENRRINTVLFPSIQFVLMYNKCMRSVWSWVYFKSSPFCG